MKKILILDDHEVFLDGLKSIIQKIPNLSADLVTNLENLNQKISKDSYDLILMDYIVPNINPLCLIHELKEKFLNVKIAVITSLNDEQIKSKLIELNVQGYILKSESTKSIELAIRKILDGQNYFSNLTSFDFSPIENPFIKLTTKEIEFVKLISKGYSNKEIAKKFDISVRTVEAHKRNIDAKLGKISKVKMNNLIQYWKI